MKMREEKILWQSCTNKNKIKYINVYLQNIVKDRKMKELLKNYIYEERKN